MTSTSIGTWIAKFRDADEGRREKHSLGDFDHLPPSHRYDAAKAPAEEWFKHLRKGGTRGKVTVRTACASCVEHLRSLGKGKTADDVKRRFAQYVNDKPLGQIELQRLKPRDVDIWRKSLAATMATPQHKSKAPTRPRSASTHNRDMTPLRAALNLAPADGHVTTDAAWKAKMRPLKDAVIAAELPAAATAYALRHSTITDLIALHKLDTLTVAQLSGTSLLMIEKHYGRLLREHAAKALASLTL